LTGRCTPRCSRTYDSGRVSIAHPLIYCDPPIAQEEADPVRIFYRVRVVRGVIQAQKREVKRTRYAPGDSFGLLLIQR